MTGDLDLLETFARENSQDAFGEIVRRHLNLVYSAALRQVRSPQLAEEIAQTVFTDLARQAGKLRPDTILTAWLYAVTRRTAVDVIRKESRRQLREQIAVEVNHMNVTANEWMQIEPLLDDAMAALDETDRSAVLLRYFENKNLREVGEVLGASEDAAQKRVSRAVERLRDFFSKRKVTVGAGGLAVLISANAVQSAPVGLAVTISAAAIAGTAVSTSTVIAATKAIAMTTLHKTLVTATVAVLAGTGIYEARQASQLREQNQTLQQQQAPLAEQIRQLQRERDDATNRLANLLAENEQLKSNPREMELLKLRGEVTQLRTANAQNDSNDPTDEAAKGVAAKVKQMKQWLEQNPNDKIPELQYLTTQEWLRGANYTRDLKTDDDFDRALSQLRRDAKRTFANSIGQALANYIAGNNGQLPGDISQLEPYFNPPIDGTILQRYQLLQAGNLNDIPNNEPLIAEKAPVDDQYDTLFKISATGYSYQGTGTSWVNGSGKGDFGTNITAKIKPFERQMN
jgi:RNA polymerase sigma factor (sigma-70 family)